MGFQGLSLGVSLERKILTSTLYADVTSRSLMRRLLKLRLSEAASLGDLQEMAGAVWENEATKEEANFVKQMMDNNISKSVKVKMAMHSADKAQEYLRQWRSTSIPDWIRELGVLLKKDICAFKNASAIGLGKACVAVFHVR